MDVRGERIIIFGDSLSHHGADSAPEIWDVDQGSNRSSGQPGDLLASLLAEQGAKAVRVNARVSRSAHNFFSRENHQALLASDAAFKPTLVFVILGTNDIGLNMTADKQAMERLRDAYKSTGAKVWGVGPFMYGAPQLNAQAEPVIAMMRSVFGDRYIDPRSITAMVGRAGDGVHFGVEGARVTALSLADLILTTKNPFPWKPFAIGAAAVVGIGIVWSAWAGHKRPGAPLLGPPLYRVAYKLVHGVGTKNVGKSERIYVDEGVTSLEAAQAQLRALKRRGLWAQIETADGKHVPVPGAKRPLDFDLGDGLGASNASTSEQLLHEVAQADPELYAAVEKFKAKAIKRRYDDPNKARGECDRATEEFVKTVPSARLTKYRFDTVDDTKRLRRIYGMSDEAIKEMQERDAEMLSKDYGDREDLFHEVAVTPDGYAIDFTANQFVAAQDQRLPVPFVYKLDQP